MTPNLPEPKFTALQQSAHQLAACTDQLLQQIEYDQVIDDIIEQIRASLELDDIFTTTSVSLRKLLNADRVGVFRFTPASNWDEGEFVAEDVGAEFPSAKVAKISHYCCASPVSIDYLQGHVQAIADTDHAGCSDLQIQLFAQLQVRASLTVPVLQGEALWGLLCIHQCARPRHWQRTEISFVQKIAGHFASALQQAEQLEQLKKQASLLAQAQAQDKALLRQQALVKIVSKIRQSLELSEICQTATDEVRQLLEADRVAIYRFNSDWSGDFFIESVAAAWQPLVGVSPTIEDTHLMETQGGRYATGETFAIPDIYTAGHTDCHVELLEQFQARAYAIAPIFQDDHLWGLLAAFQNSAPRHWPTDEVELLAQIGEQLGIALQQAEFVQKIQAQSEELEQLVQKLKQSQLQLVQSEKMASLGQLVAGVAHEINNPINFIHGNLSHARDYAQKLLELASATQALQPESEPTLQTLAHKLAVLDLDFISEDFPKILSSMKVGTERIQKIVLALRNFARLDEAQFKAVDIHEGIESTLLILGNRLKLRDAHASIEVIKSYGELPRVECFPAQLNQVLMNLISNAIDAVGEVSQTNRVRRSEEPQNWMPKIWITTQRDAQEHVKITIRDNGMGIKITHQNQLFDHFFTTKPIGKGTGLGLSISHKIITQKHGGTLSFNAPAEGGAEFIVRLPLKFQQP